MLVRKSISRKITHPQSWNLQIKLTGEKLKGDGKSSFSLSLLLLQPFNFSPVSFACNFQEWECVILREIDFLSKICWSIPCLHPSSRVLIWLWRTNYIVECADLLPFACWKKLGLCLFSKRHFMKHVTMFLNPTEQRDIFVFSLKLQPIFVGNTAISVQHPWYVQR